jgi:hypothetical protein
MFRTKKLSRSSLAGVLAAAAFAFAGASASAMECATTEEVEAFRLRHLQSQLMLAGLSCNQRDAYNTFVLAFRPQLATAGGSLIRYFERTGGGAVALNRHVTEIANAAGLDRAEKRDDYCRLTWNMFWNLSQTPQDLARIAGANMIQSIEQPIACSAVPPMVTAGTTQAPAAAEVAPVPVSVPAAPAAGGAGVPTR